jgi:ABC-type Zn uptake system ZnuABC Zn-binding protein ZnuA
VDALVAGIGGPDKVVIEAAAGIPGLDKDPHCWLDPMLVVIYAGNIAEGLTKVDPQGAGSYRSNAAAYSESLRELDLWIQAQVQTIPIGRRLLVTNHESLGRFAARYGFEIVGSIFPTPYWWLTSERRVHRPSLSRQAVVAALPSRWAPRQGLR